MIPRKISFIFSALFLLALIDGISTAQAQGPDDRPRRGGREGRRESQTAPTVENIVARMMAFDKNKDGKLTKDEITDPRLMRVFERADANHDGVVTREELTDLAKKMMAEMGQSRGGFGGGFGGDGPDGDDGPGGGGFGGPRGFGFFGPPPPRHKPGEVLPTELQNALELTADQKAKIAELQKEVTAKMDKILTEKQKTAHNTMGPREGDGPPPPPYE